MSLFKKESSDIVDFTALQKRGILKRVVKDSSEDEDTNPQIPQSLPPVFQGPGESPQSPLDMFSSLDILASSAPSQIPSSAMAINGLSESDLSSLKLKVDDLEFKLEKLLEKLEFIEGKLPGN